MAERKTGVILDARQATSGDHICCAYDSDSQFRQIVTAYFSAGIEAGERIASYAPSAKLSEVTGWLTNAGHDLKALSAAGQIVLGDVRVAYLAGGTFDPDRRIAEYTSVVNEALTDGFTGLRVVGDVATIMDDAQVRGRWAAYDLRADFLAARAPFSAICTFDHRQCDPAVLEAAESVHPLRLGLEMIPAQGFRVYATGHGGLALAGEIDFASSEAVRLLMMDMAGTTAPVIDVTGLTFVDAAGIRAVAAGAAPLLPVHGTVEIRGASRLFRRLWSLMGLDQHTTIRVIDE